jgi:hypothetical protein
LGSTQSGVLAQWLGAPWAMAIGAAIAGAVIVAIRLVRPEVFVSDRSTFSVTETVPPDSD